MGHAVVLAAGVVAPVIPCGLSVLFLYNHSEGLFGVVGLVGVIGDA